MLFIREGHIILFDEQCMRACDLIMRKLIEALVMASLSWTLTFEVMCVIMPQELFMGRGNTSSSNLSIM